MLMCESHQLFPAEVWHQQSSHAVAAAIRFGSKPPELNQITLLTPSLLLHFHPVINPIAVSSQQHERIGGEDLGLQTPPRRKASDH